MECPTQTLFQMFQSYNICKYRTHECLCGLLWKQVSVCMHVIFSHIYMYLHTQARVGGRRKPASKGWFHSPWVLLPGLESLLFSAARVLKKTGSLKTEMLCEWRSGFYMEFRLSLRMKESSGHMAGRGSPQARKSSMERELSDWLQVNALSKTQFRFWCAEPRACASPRLSDPLPQRECVS